MKICKECGTVYESGSVCPKCSTKDFGGNNIYNEQGVTQDYEEKRKKDWIKLIIGIPLFIAFIYLVCYLFTIIK